MTFVCSVHHQVSAINGILEHLLLLEEDALGGSIMPQELIARVIVTNSIFCVSWPLYLILVLTLFKVGTFKIPVNGGLDSKCGVRFDVGKVHRCQHGYGTEDTQLRCSGVMLMSLLE